MPLLSAIMVLLAAAMAGIFVSQALPDRLPVPLVQIALGCLIGCFTSLHLELDPDVFFLLFLPPLLFRDGWRMPKDALLKDRHAILGLAIGLVAVTVAAIGCCIHALFPAIPLAVAFAPAAILSPTDPVAVPAIAARLPLPKRLVHVLEGEALLNDAIGLVCFRLAVAASLSGHFSLGDAAVTLVWLAAVGIMIGAGLTWTVMTARARLSRRDIDPAALVLITLPIPFGAYALAEQCHGSGILAAVAAGMTMGVAERRADIDGQTRTRLGAIWGTFQTAGSGLVFVLMGEQLPGVVRSALNAWEMTEHGDPRLFPLTVLAIVAELFAVRYGWVWIAARLTLWRTARRGEAMLRPGWPMLAAVSLGGARGAVSLAGVLTLPLAAADGTPFPAREMAILLAAAVIIVSLLLASVGLPWLLRGRAMPVERSTADAEDAVRQTATRAALRELRRAEPPDWSTAPATLHHAAASRIIGIYESRLLSPVSGSPGLDAIDHADRLCRHLASLAFQAERAVIEESEKSRRLETEVARRLLRELDLLEEAASPARSRR